MNYRKYKYFRLDGSSTIMDRRDMVRDFQRRYVIPLLITWHEHALILTVLTVR